MEQLSATRTRRGSIGLDGAESQYCDLSGRGLATAQIERTLRVFETAEAIDLSNNEIERIPTTIPTTLVALDLSFNLLGCAEGIDRLKNLQEIHLGFNRLVDVSVLEFCPRLQRVNLSGNRYDLSNATLCAQSLRLMNTKGLETLVYLENLDLSENLIEFPEALRPLSLNQNLTHLTLRGNPIALNPKHDYRVLLLDLIPSVLVLDDKKIRSAVKYKSIEGGGAAASKSLSYSRLYDDKKQFIIQNRNRPHPATRVKPLVAGDSSSKYDGTMFLQPAVEPSHERVRSLQLQQALGDSFEMASPPPPPPVQAQIMSSLAAAYDARATMSSGGSKSTGATNAPPPLAPYMSLYDRLAQANGMQQLTKSAIPPSKPIESRHPSNATDSNTVATDRSRRQPATAAVIAQAPPSITTKPRAAGISPSKSTMRGGTNSVQRPAAPVRSIPAAHDASHSKRPLARPAEQQHLQRGANAASSGPLSPSTSRAKPLGAPGNENRQQQLRDEKQRSVLSVIQNLIQHKKQTLATLARASSVAT